MTIKGFNNQKGYGDSNFVTVQSAGSDKQGIPASCMGVYEVLAATAISSVDQSVDAKQLTIDLGTAHSARKGDFIRMTTGGIIGWEYEIREIVSANVIKVWNTSATLPLATEEAEILRPIVQRFNSDGSTIVTIDPAGLATEAKQDDQIVQETATNTKLDALIATDFATEAKQDDAITELQEIEADVEAMSAKLPATLGQKASAASLAVVISSDQSAVPVSGPLTDAELRATAVPVSGTFWQVTQPVSGPLTDAELRATAVPVSGPITDAELRATAVPVSGPLTDAELRATAVPVSGPLTDAELRATAVPVSLASSPAPAVQAGTVSSAKITVGTSAVRATVSGGVPDANRKKLIIKSNKDNVGNIYLGGSGVTTGNGLEIIGPDRLEFEFDSGDYHLISDTAAQVVEILEKV